MITRWTWIDDVAERILNCDTLSLGKNGKFWNKQLTKAERVELASILQKKIPNVCKKRDTK